METNDAIVLKQILQLKQLETSNKSE